MMSNDRKYYSKARQRKQDRLLVTAHLAGKPQRVLVFGLGLNGGEVGGASFLAVKGAKVTVTDLKSKKALSASLFKLSSFPDIKYVPRQASLG